MGKRTASGPLVEALREERPSRADVKAQINHLRGVARAERRNRESLRAQYGDLPAEVQSVKLNRQEGRARLRKHHLSAIRAAYMSRVGRKIDLVSLLTLCRKDGSPVWALVDPAIEVNAILSKICLPGLSQRNGRRVNADGAGYCMVGESVVKIPVQAMVYDPVGGIPPLPVEARALATDRAIRRRAKWVGLLYQPAEWAQLKPDPAIVVEWKDRPGEYYALAIWGGDMPRIMEWVD